MISTSQALSPSSYPVVRYDRRSTSTGGELYQPPTSYAPNARTLQAIEERKKKIFPSMTAARGTTAVHVRHGDKWKESELIENKQYLEVVEELHRQEGERWSLSRSIFLSTEDQATADFFQRLPDWDVTFTQVQRYTDRDVSPMAFAERIGRSNEMLNSLTSLDIALQCDAFVVTLSSNWCRLIDELRATVRCKADHPSPRCSAEQHSCGV